jgi:hypothetical protein
LAIDDLVEVRGIADIGGLHLSLLAETLGDRRAPSLVGCRGGAKVRRTMGREQEMGNGNGKWDIGNERGLPCRSATLLLRERSAYPPLDFLFPVPRNV